jgi:hypothetical protein
MAVPILTTPWAPAAFEGGLVDLARVHDLGTQAGDAALDLFDVVDAAEPGDDLLSLRGHVLLPDQNRFVAVTHSWPIFASGHVARTE